MLKHPPILQNPAYPILFYIFCGQWESCYDDCDFALISLCWISHSDHTTFLFFSILLTFELCVFGHSLQEKIKFYQEGAASKKCPCRLHLVLKLIGQFTSYQQPAICHRTLPVVIVVDDGKRRVISGGLRVGAYIHRVPCGIVAESALRSQLCIFDCPIVKVLKSPTRWLKSRCVHSRLFP